MDIILNICHPGLVFRGIKVVNGGLSIHAVHGMGDSSITALKVANKPMVLFFAKFCLISAVEFRRHLPH